MRNSKYYSQQADDPLWYKDAVIYEIHVRAFYDSDADGIGDFRGLTEKLDYLQDLGVTAIWLLPFYPSPLRDDGYDIADYYDDPSDLRDAAGFQDVPARGARTAVCGSLPSWCSTTLPISIPGSSGPGAPRRDSPAPRFLCLERHAREIPGGAHHLQGFRALQLDLGSGGPGLLLAPLLLATSRI